jgi:hypothetical protein
MDGEMMDELTANMARKDAIEPIVDASRRSNDLYTKLRTNEDQIAQKERELRGKTHDESVSLNARLVSLKDQCKRLLSQQAAASQGKSSTGRLTNSPRAQGDLVRLAYARVWEDARVSPPYKITIVRGP